MGEVFDTVHDCALLIEEQLIDYIRTSPLRAGGITHLRKIAALAEIHQVRTGWHGATDLSPVTMAAALHFDLAVHNFGIQEYMPHTAETDAVFPHAYRQDGGVMHPGEAPGLGVTLDESGGREASLPRRLPARESPGGRHRPRLVGLSPRRGPWLSSVLAGRHRRTGALSPAGGPR